MMIAGSFLSSALKFVAGAAMVLGVGYVLLNGLPTGDGSDDQQRPAIPGPVGTPFGPLPIPPSDAALGFNPADITDRLPRAEPAVSPGKPLAPPGPDGRIIPAEGALAEGGRTYRIGDLEFTISEGVTLMVSPVITDDGGTSYFWIRDLASGSGMAVALDDGVPISRDIKPGNDALRVDEMFRRLTGEMIESVTTPQPVSTPRAEDGIFVLSSPGQPAIGGQTYRIGDWLLDIPAGITLYFFAAVNDPGGEVTVGLLDYSTGSGIRLDKETGEIAYRLVTNEGRAKELDRAFDQIEQSLRPAP